MTDVIEANPRAVAGANNPPPFEAHKVNLTDLATEARHWADGAGVTDQKQADTVEQLIEDIRLGIQAADASRVEENKPFDAGKAAVQAKYNDLIADTKTQTGIAVAAQKALKATLKPWKDKLEAERLAAVEAARVEAQRIADEAAKARAAAPEDDLGALEVADILTSKAEDAAKALKAVEKDKVSGLRKTWTPVLKDQKTAILFYMKTRPEEFIALVERLAVVDVRDSKKREIPGFVILEGSTL